MKLTHLLTAGLVLLPAESLLAQGANDTAGMLKQGFAEVSGWVNKSIELVPADKFTYKPVQTVRTFGQLVAHLADSYNYYCARAQGKTVQWSDAAEKGATDKATLVQKLGQAQAVCTAAHANASNIGQLMANIAHTNLHYGNMITYLRMLGLTPPSS